MPGDLTGIRGKIARAQVNLDLLNFEQTAWYETKPYTIVPEINEYLSSDTVNVFFIVESVEPVPMLIRTIIGDILYDLRSALDHLAWQLVVANHGAPTHETAFPILEDRLSPKGGIRTVDIAGGVAALALTIIERLQPYNRIDDPTTDPLWLLNTLCNIDKHRTLFLVGHAYESLIIRFHGEAHVTQMGEPIPLRPRMALGTLGIPVEQFRRDEPVDMDINPSTLVAFDSSEICAGRTVSNVLSDLKEMVESVVNGLAIFVRATVTGTKT